MRAEAPVDKARRVGCRHPHFYSFSGRCESCRKEPLSPNFPDPVWRGTNDPE